MVCMRIGEIGHKWKTPLTTGPLHVTVNTNISIVNAWINENAFFVIDKIRYNSKTD